MNVSNIGLLYLLLAHQGLGGYHGVFGEDGRFSLSKFEVSDRY